MANVEENGRSFTGQGQVFLTARLNAPILPIDRITLYEEPLEILLQIDELGEIVSGNSILSDTGGIAYCEIEIETVSAEPHIVDGVISALEEIGAPKGSTLIIEGEGDETDRYIPFGQFEGMAVRLGILEEARAEMLRSTIKEARHLLGEARLFSGYRQAQPDSILYIYGRSYTEMRSRLIGGSEDVVDITNVRIDQVA